MTTLSATASAGVPLAATDWQGAKQDTMVKFHLPTVALARSASPPSPRVLSHQNTGEMSPGSPGADSEVDDIHSHNLTLRGFVNQYIGMSMMNGIIVLVIFVVDMFSIGGLISIKPTGEIVLLTLDVLTLMLFTLEVGISMVTLGYHHFFEDQYSRIDLAMVILINSFYIGAFIASTSVVDVTAKEDDRITVKGSDLKSIADAFRSVLRLARLAILAVRVDLALRGSAKKVSNRKRLHFASTRRQHSD